MSPLFCALFRADTASTVCETQVVSNHSPAIWAPMALEIPDFPGVSVPKHQNLLNWAHVVTIYYWELQLVPMA